MKLKEYYSYNEIEKNTIQTKEPTYARLREGPG
jgi:hypothetical protein